MDYEKKYKRLYNFISDLYPFMSEYCKEKVEGFLPELKESEDELTWLTKYVEEEAYSLSMDIRDSEDRIKLKKLQKALAWLEKQVEPTDKGEISDGYHTFNELYYYRMLYNAAFFNMLPKEWVHKSKRHNDGEECFGGGWFIVMANLPTGQISNHYELKDWDLFQIPEKEVADRWDGHTPQEAAYRLHKYLLEKQGEQVVNEPDWCHHKVDLSDCSEEYRKAYYDGWNNCNQQHSQCKAEQKSVWSEEDEHRVKDTIYFLETAKKHYASTVELGACIDWLKSLKPQNRDIYNPYKEVVSSIAEMCDKYKSFSDDRANDFVNNVKVKCKDAKEYDSIYPQNIWKPSDEQMDAFKQVYDWYNNNFAPSETLTSLYNDLKKLKGE